jgi:hypothetical protein
MAVVILTCLIIIFYVGGTYSSGSLGYAQQYQFNVSNTQLIKAVERFKSENKSFNPPPNYSEPDSADTYIPDFFNVYLFYYDQNSIVYLVIDKDHQDINKSTIYFVSINEGLKGPFYKRVNKDFDRDDNLKIKKEFEERILKKLGLPYKDKGNGMFIFWK